MTVSRALKVDGTVAPATRARILRVVETLGYVPDQIASSLSSRRSGFVALLVPSLNNLPLAQTTHALVETLQGAGLQVLIGYTNYETSREEKLIAALLRRRPEAVIVVADGHSRRTRALLRGAGVPIIHLWDWPQRPIGHVVGFSNAGVARDVVGFLVARGYRRLAYLGETNDAGTRGARRREGFIQAVEELKLGPVRVYDHAPPPLAMLHGRAALPLMLQKWPEIDAIVCVSDPGAFGVLTQAQIMGLAVPAELGIVGFGDFELSRCSMPALTTVAVDGARIGREAAKLLTDILDEVPGRVAPRRRVKIDAILTPRGTTR